MSLWGSLRAVCESARPATTDRRLAEKLYAELDDEDILEALEHLVAHQRRILTHTAERKISLRRSTTKLPRGLDDEFRSLFGQRMALGNKQFVLFEQATVSEHHTRIDMLLSMRNGIDKTIALHERAITLITSSGVQCLADIARAA